MLTYLQAADRGRSALGERFSCRRTRSRPAADTEEEGARRRAGPVCRRRRRRLETRVSVSLTHARTRVYLPMWRLQMI